MASNRFTADELALFEEQFKRVPAWSRWSKRQNANGGDVLQVALGSDRKATLSLSKTDDNRYAATGFDGWSLTICDALAPLLEVLARMVPQTPAWQPRVLMDRSAA